jgi:hypothetical protein
MLEVGTITVVHTDLTSSFIPSEQVIKVGRPILAFESFPTPTNPHSHLEQQKQLHQKLNSRREGGSGLVFASFSEVLSHLPTAKARFPKEGGG